MGTKKICITGHKGFVGSYISKRLEGIGLDLAEGNDIIDCNLPDVDIVIHLAAQADVIKSIENPTECVRNNILGTVRLSEKYKNTKFIFASTVAAEDKVSPYGLSKYCCEEFIKMLFNDYVILRFANIYGEGSRSVVDKFIKSDIIIYGDGSQTRTFIHIDDLIEAILLSFNWKKGTYYLGGKDISILELAKLTGKPIKFKNWRKGEIKYSKVKNTTPNWKAKTNIINYINETKHFNSESQ